MWLRLNRFFPEMQSQVDRSFDRAHEKRLLENIRTSQRSSYCFGAPHLIVVIDAFRGILLQYLKTRRYNNEVGTALEILWWLCIGTVPRPRISNMNELGARFVRGVFVAAKTSNYIPPHAFENTHSKACDGICHGCFQ